MVLKPKWAIIIPIVGLVFSAVGYFGGWLRSATFLELSVGYPGLNMYIPTIIFVVAKSTCKCRWLAMKRSSLPCPQTPSPTFSEFFLPLVISSSGPNCIARERSRGRFPYRNCPTEPSERLVLRVTTT